MQDTLLQTDRIRARETGASAPGEAQGPRAVVTVLMPVYNAAATVERAIRSVAAQTLRNLEIVAYDDCSQDESFEILQTIALTEPRLRVLRGDVNRGPAAARNRALARATGEWIAILDADDWYATDRLERLVRVGVEAGADVVMDNQVLYDEGAGQIMGRALLPSDRCTSMTLNDLLRNSLTGRVRYDYGLLQPVIRRSFLIANGIRYPDKCRFGEDFILILDCFVAGAKMLLSRRPMYYVAQPYGLLSRRVREGDGYDFVNMKRFNDAAVERYRRQITPAQLRLLQRRGRSIDLFAHYLAAKGAIRQNPWRLVGLLSQPRLWPYVWRTGERQVRAMMSSLLHWRHG